MNKRVTLVVVAALAALSLTACGNSGEPAAPVPASVSAPAPKPDPLHTFITAANAAGLNLDENEYRGRLATIGNGPDVCRTGLLFYVDMDANFRIMAGGSVDKGAAHNAVLNYCDAMN